MERGAPFSHIQLPQSNSGVNLEQQSNPNPMTNSGTASQAGERNKGKGPEVQQQPCTVREQEIYMPLTNVIRIMRTSLPREAKISDDAKETILECVSMFIRFVTGEANECCQRDKRNTINAEDIFLAMRKLGFDNYVDPLTAFITRHRGLDNDGGSGLRSEPPALRQSYGGNDVNPPHGMGDQSMGIGGGSGQDGSGGSGNFSSSVNGVPEYDPYGHYK